MMMLNSRAGRSSAAASAAATEQQQGLLSADTAVVSDSKIHSSHHHHHHNSSSGMLHRNKSDSNNHETFGVVVSSPPPSSGSPAAVAAALAPLASSSSSAASVVSSTGLAVLALLALQNCSKNLIMRFVMIGQPKFLTSAAVIGSEMTKLSLSVLYILVVQRKPFSSIVRYLQEDQRNTLLLVVPASAYNLQMSMEYIALANLDPAMFSVLVQIKQLFTASFSALVLGKRLRNIQVISLVLLTAGVMLCNLPNNNAAATTTTDDEDSDLLDAKTIKGTAATITIALSSGFASVYTEKVIKGGGANAKRVVAVEKSAEYGLAYTQVQLALMSLVTIGAWACMMDRVEIAEKGLFFNFSTGAYMTVLNSAMGGLIVATVLKYADSVLKGYATAVSVILTGVSSMLLFGTQLSIIYYMGIVNVVTSIILYNGKNMDDYFCSSTPSLSSLPPTTTTSSNANGSSSTTPAVDGGAPTTAAASSSSSSHAGV